MVYFTVLKTCSSKNNHLKEQKARVGKYIVIHMPFSAQVSRIYKVLLSKEKEHPDLKKRGGKRKKHFIKKRDCPINMKKCLVL